MFLSEILVVKLSNLWCIVSVGTVESNSQTSDAVCLTINFHKYNLKVPIYYPPFDKVNIHHMYVIVHVRCPETSNPLV